MGVKTKDHPRTSVKWENLSALLLLTLTTLKYFCRNHGDQMCFFQFKIMINVLGYLALSASFENLCYGSMAIIIFNYFSAGIVFS